MRATIGATGAIAMLALASAPALAATSLVGNGGFETPAITGDYQTVNAGDTTLAPWSVTAGTVDIVAKSLLAPNSGNQSLDLNGTNAGTLTQTVATVVGHTYRVDFFLAGNPDPNGNPPAVKTLTAKLGSTTAGYSFDVTGHSGTSMGWIAKSLTGVVATGTSTALTFASTTTGYSGPELDDISITDTTAPPAALPDTPYVPLLALTGIAAIGGGTAILRRRSL